jgi:hypothetical protein
MIDMVMGSPAFREVRRSEPVEGLRRFGNDRRRGGSSSEQRFFCERDQRLKRGGYLTAALGQFIVHFIRSR